MHARKLEVSLGSMGPRTSQEDAGQKRCLRYSRRGQWRDTQDQQLGSGGKSGSWRWSSAGPLFCLLFVLRRGVLFPMTLAECFPIHPNTFDGLSQSFPMLRTWTHRVWKGDANKNTYGTCRTGRTGRADNQGTRQRNAQVRHRPSALRRPSFWATQQSLETSMDHVAQVGAPRLGDRRRRCCVGVLVVYPGGLRRQTKVRRYEGRHGATR